MLHKLVKKEIEEVEEGNVVLVGMSQGGEFSGVLGWRGWRTCLRRRKMGLGMEKERMCLRGAMRQGMFFEKRW
jgi:hypothetical protein